MLVRIGGIGNSIRQMQVDIMLVMKSEIGSVDQCPQETESAHDQEHASGSLPTERKEGSHCDGNQDESFQISSTVILIFFALPTALPFLM